MAKKQPPPYEAAIDLCGRLDLSVPYSAELELYARSLPATFGQAGVPFLDAQPSAKLVPGITRSKIENSSFVEFDVWPKGLRELAVRLGAAASAIQSKGTK